ncbi:MAG: hypothetical protein ACE5FH_10535 [Candidatus Zixiibacteriota bacterium]
MRLNRSTAIVIQVTTIACLIAVLQMLRLPSHTYLWREIHNLGHTPIFGIIALAVLGMSRRLLDKRISNLWSHYALAFIVSVGIGLIIELVQMVGPRDASAEDLLRDTAGAAGFLGLHCFYCSGSAISLAGPRLRRRLIAFSALLVLLLSSTPVLFWTAAYLHRSSKAPYITSFDGVLGRAFIELNNAKFTSVSLSEPAAAAIDGPISSVAFYPGEYSEIKIVEPFPDWRQYDSLQFDVLVQEDTAILLTIRIDDRHHRGDPLDRFNRTEIVQPGWHRLVISLNDVRTAPKNRRMDMAAIRDIHLFLSGIKKRVTLFFSDLILVRNNSE